MVYSESLILHSTINSSFYSDNLIYLLRRQSFSESEMVTQIRWNLIWKNKGNDEKRYRSGERLNTKSRFLKQKKADKIVLHLNVSELCSTIVLIIKWPISLFTAHQVKVRLLSCFFRYYNKQSPETIKLPWDLLKWYGILSTSTEYRWRPHMLVKLSLIHI